jgi:peptide deformylase
VADPVKVINKEIKNISEKMVEAMLRANGVGIAAPQIGVAKRIIVFDLDGKLYILINPEIIETSEEEEENLEGCLSIPGVDAPVVRKLRAQVRGITLDEKEIEVEGEGLMARALQHEVDHLGGILFIDYLTPVRRRSVLNDYMRQQREEKS